MAVKLKSGPQITFPVECECSSCGRRMDATELTDFQKMRGGAAGPDTTDYPMAYTECPACHEKAFPVNGKLMEVLYTLIENEEKGLSGEVYIETRTPGVSIIKGTRLKKPFTLCCLNGKCHTTFEVSTTDGIKDSGECHYYVKCPNCGWDVQVYNDDVRSYLSGVFLARSSSYRE